MKIKNIVRIVAVFLVAAVAVNGLEAVGKGNWKKGGSKKHGKKKSGKKYNKTDTEVNSTTPSPITTTTTNTDPMASFVFTNTVAMPSIVPIQEKIEIIQEKEKNQEASLSEPLNDKNIAMHVEKLGKKDSELFRDLFLIRLKTLFFAWIKRFLLEIPEMAAPTLPLKIISSHNEQRLLIEKLSDDGKHLLMEFDDCCVSISPQMNPAVLTILFEALSNEVSIVKIRNRVDKALFCFSDTTKNLLSFFKEISDKIACKKNDKIELNAWIEMLQGFHSPQLPKTIDDCKQLHGFLDFLNRALELDSSVTYSYLVQLYEKEESVSIHDLSPQISDVCSKVDSLGKDGDICSFLLSYWSNIILKRYNKEVNRCEIKKIKNDFSYSSKQEKKNKKKQEKKNKKKLFKANDAEKNINQKDSEPCIDENKKIVEKGLSDGPIIMSPQEAKELLKETRKFITFNNRIDKKEAMDNKNHIIFRYNYRYDGHVFFLKLNSQKNNFSLKTSFDTVLDRYKETKFDKFHIMPNQIMDYLPYGYFIESVTEENFEQMFLNVVDNDVDFNDIKLYVKGSDLKDVVVIPCWFINDERAYQQIDCEKDIKKYKKSGCYDGAIVFIFDHKSGECIHRCFHPKKLIKK